MRSVAFAAVVCFASSVSAADSVPPALNFKVKTIDGKEMKLSEYKGKVVLVVNVASQCGLTPQYKGLQELYTKYKDKGLVILGFPANEFGGQEPGSDEEIKEFCSSNYKVTFPMFSKVVVKGKDQNDFFKYLTKNSKPAGDIQWNFEKFLIGRDGKLAGRFRPQVAPSAKELTTAIEKAIEKKAE